MWFRRCEGERVDHFLAIVGFYASFDPGSGQTPHSPTFKPFRLEKSININKCRVDISRIQSRSEPSPHPFACHRSGPSLPSGLPGYGFRRCGS
jgi:hypothetical protein